MGSKMSAGHAENLEFVPIVPTEILFHSPSHCIFLLF